MAENLILMILKFQILINRIGMINLLKIILVDKFRQKIGDKFIPTVEQADDCLGKFHGRKLTSLHVYQEKVLVECLERENYALPAFAGGLSRAVRE